MVYCANGICGSLGSFASMGGMPGRLRSYRDGSLGQSTMPTNFSVRWGPAGPPSDAEIFGKGCDPNAVPTDPDELALVWNLIEAEREYDLVPARCEQSNPNNRAGAIACTSIQQGNVEGTKIVPAQDAIATYCAVASAQAAAMPDYSTTADDGAVTNGGATPPETSEPLPDSGGMSGTTKMLLVGAGLVVVLGGAYMFTRKR
jgi:LPXTG-motif cell wall-anchored protein